ncbi:helix-turn-helix domain-containing protein [Enterococcus faecalis]|uniref:helix-turn-helix domain-containing protein n=1 Tax=Enterococcus faecalis TaxID=1351 RepID=UPI001E34F20C|nr:helix-turn-helix transcriptional regulator [Enterococcus faecalis]MCD4978464.1 helix-turn-helix domain-containing protein [Enterococcus faecalis]
MIEYFGNNVARLRKERKWSQDQLAEKIGVQKQTISNIERGTRYPTFENLEKIAKEFDVTAIQLFGTAKEIVVSDIPVILDQIDHYDLSVKEILKIESFMKSYPKKEIDHLVEQIQYIQENAEWLVKVVNDKR